MFDSNWELKSFFLVRYSFIIKVGDILLDFFFLSFMSRIKVYENGIFNRDEFVIVYYVLELDLGLMGVVIIIRTS